MEAHTRARAEPYRLLLVPAPVLPLPSGNLPKSRQEWEAEHPDASWDSQRDTLLPGYYDEWARARRHPSGTVYKAVVGVTGDGTNDAPALKVGVVLCVAVV